MKNNKKYFATLIAVMAGLSLLTTQCKQDTETVTQYDTVYVNVHDTVYGKAISGNATYMDLSGVATPAKGAVINLYLGTSATGNVVASTFADANGNYQLPYLMPNTYFLFAKYNNENVNVKAINGINFATNPGYTITLGSTAVTQAVQLVSIATTSTLKVSLDTVNNPGFRPVSWEIHGKCNFSFPDHATGTELAGGFNEWMADQFVFDAANPANTKISAYVLLSTVNTLEPDRDALLTGGCVPKTLLVAVDSVNQIAVPETDTARFTSTSVVKYGDGYLAHGTLTAFYHHGPGMPYPPDTSYYQYTGGFKAATATPIAQQYWNTRVTKPCDLYFVYQGSFAYSKNTDGSTKNLCFVFEGEFAIYPQADYYISSAHFSNSPIKVTTHVQFLGANNDTNYPQ